MLRARFFGRGRTSSFLSGEALAPSGVEADAGEKRFDFGTRAIYTEAIDQSNECF